MFRSSVKAKTLQLKIIPLIMYIRKSRNNALIEKHDICWRRRYLETIKEYRQLDRPIYYLDETWLNADDTTSST